MVTETSLRPTARKRAATDHWRTVCAFVLPLTLYIVTLAPTIYNLDSAELTTAAATGGITRATGYPLYLVLGWLWSHIPIGDVGYRMNLFSALNGALTVALAERILRRLGVGPWATLGALGLLACAPFFWALSLIAEVYTLHTALMAGLILLLLRWAKQPTARRLAAVGLVLGLGMSHHVTMALFVPGCVWFVASGAPRQALRPHALAAAAGALLLGLSLYLYLPLRYAAQPAFNYAGHYDAQGQFVPVNLQTIGGMWWLVSGKAFDHLPFSYTSAELWAEAVQFGNHVRQAFFAVGVGPGLLGLVVLTRRDWRFGGALLLMFLANAIFFINYRVVDKETMFLPMYVIWALWLGVGYQWLLAWVSAPATGVAQRWGLLLVRSMLVMSVLAALAWNWRLTDLSHDWSARERGEAILRQARPHALVFGWWDTVPVIEYLQLVEGRRPDVQPINRFLISYADLRALIDRESRQRPVYIDSTTEDLLRSYDAERTASMYRLIPRASAHETVTRGENANLMREQAGK